MAKKRRTDPDYVRLPVDQKAFDEGYVFDDEQADHAVSFFTKYLKHGEGRFHGKPFILLPWELDYTRRLFGWVHKETGLRRFKKGGIWIAKKNGKSAYGAGVAGYGLVGDGEMSAKVFSAAADRDQASIVFNVFADMVRASPELARHIEIIPSTKRMVYMPTGSIYKALSSDVNTKEGLNASMIIFDELHAQKTRELFDGLKYAGAARSQPLMLTLSTAGYDRESIGYTMYRYAKDIISGVNDQDIHFLPMVFEAEEADDWSDPKIWRKANPSLGETITESDFRADFEAAKNSPSDENVFRRYRLNQWTNSETVWLQPDVWQRCGAEPVIPEGSDVFIGLDLSATADITALSVWCPATNSIQCYFWVPEKVTARSERPAYTLYRGWRQGGFLEFTPGDWVDYQFVVNKIAELAGRFNIITCAVDPWMSVKIVPEIQNLGVNVNLCSQGFKSMSSPTKLFERMVRQGTIRHGNNPVMRWMVANTMLEIDPAGNVKPSKKRSTEKIDGVVATVMAIAAWEELGDGGSVYEREGILTV